MRKSYTYKVTFPDQGWWYWGAHKENGKSYSGSPITHKDKWENFYYEIQILEYFDTWDEARAVEKRLIRPDLNKEGCLNEHNGGGFSSAVAGKGGKISGRQNVENGHLRSISSKGGTIGGSISGPKVGRRNVESGHMQSITSMGGKVGGKVTSSQKWQCLITNHVSTPGPLTLWQKARGIDPSQRKRLF